MHRSIQVWWRRALAVAGLGLAAIGGSCGGRVVVEDNPTVWEGGDEGGEHKGDLGAFNAACLAYVPKLKTEDCQNCPACDALWTDLMKECPVSSACARNYCEPLGYCGCVLDCLPAGESDCLDKWTDVMRCVGSSCC
jgi:hypothetical protein